MQHLAAVVNFKGQEIAVTEAVEINVVEREVPGYSNNNCSVVYFVCKKDSTIRPHGYYCANVTCVKLGNSVGYEFEPVYAE